MIELRDVSMRFRHAERAARHQPDDPPGRDRLRHRRERLRQDRAAEADHRPACIPTEGAVRFDGRDLATLGGKELIKLRLRFGFLFQMAALFDSLTIYDNVAFGLREHHLCDEDDDRADRRRAAPGGRACPPGWSTRSRPSSPAASGSASGWPGPWRSTPRSCSTTSRPPGSTRS